MIDVVCSSAERARRSLLLDWRQVWRYNATDMTLDEWIAHAGHGAVHQLHLRARVSLPVIGRARIGRTSLANATKIHEAVGGIVPISSMTPDDVPAALETPAAAARTPPIARGRGAKPRTRKSRTRRKRAAA